MIHPPVPLLPAATEVLHGAVLAQTVSLNGVGWALIAVAVVVGIPLAIIGVIFLLVPAFRLVGSVFGRGFTFIGRTVGDAVRLVGVAITASILSLPAVFNVACGRWSRAQHYGRAVSAELTAAGTCMYRLFIGNPARLLFLEDLVEGLERRVPAVIAQAPGATNAPAPALADPAAPTLPRPPAWPPPPGAPADPAARASIPHRKPAGRSHTFPGYEIVGTLPGGGSGSRLYVARPDEIRRAAFARDGQGGVGDVVIKSFSIADGSPLPNIIRESRALEAAKKLGLVLDDELTGDRFYYVMRYVPGDSLSLVAQRLHASSPAEGLGPYQLERAVSYVCDLIATLDQYHRAGLWHKDIKPDNIIVTPEPPAGDGRAHLVDFGLLTPLRGTMTLTTHGTEYFRDPEMVRMAYRGVKVHQVDGARFDLYGAGAVLFAVLENSFPANGGLSTITRSCPEPLRWIVRRAMTDYDKRYASASAMLADLRVVLDACRSGTIGSLRVADLTSMREPSPFDAVPAAAPVAPPEAPPSVPPAPVAARFAGAAPVPPAPEPREEDPVARAFAHAGRQLRSAAQQIESARARIKARRERARRGRRGTQATPGGRFDAGPGRGVIAAIGIVVGIGVFSSVAVKRRTITTTDTPPAAAPQGPNRHVVFAKPEAGKAAADTRAGGAKALVLREPSALIEPLFSETNRQIDRLKQRGFAILGELPADRNAADELAAAVRATVGLRELGSDDAAGQAERWLVTLGGQSAPAVVVWMAQDRAKPGELWTWVIAAPGATADVRTAVRAALTE